MNGPQLVKGPRSYPKKLRKPSPRGCRHSCYPPISACTHDPKHPAPQYIAPFERVVFEEVPRHLGVDAAHIYGGIIACLTAWCEENGIRYMGIPVATVKKAATGKGKGKKEAIVAAQIKWTEANITDDNEADARFNAEAA